jgi:hypothetical protein
MESDQSGFQAVRVVEYLAQLIFQKFLVEES